MIVCTVPKFKPGDTRPTGYMTFQEWARVQHKAGLRQAACPKCGRYYFPQEFDAHVAQCCAPAPEPPEEAGL